MRKMLEINFGNRSTVQNVSCKLLDTDEIIEWLTTAVVFLFLVTRDPSVSNRPMGVYGFLLLPPVVV